MSLLDLINAVNPVLETGIALLVLWLIYRAITGSWRVWQLALGVDGRYSTSLFQGLAWTIVVLASYLLLFLARVHVGSTVALGTIPANVLTALGLSLGTTVTAAGITTGRVAKDPDLKPKAAPDDRTFGSLVADDSGQPSLVKTQLVLWTLVSLAVFIVAVADATTRTLSAANGAPLPNLPDIDTTLLVLSGIGQATYLTHKIVATPSGNPVADVAAAVGGVAPEPVAVANRSALASSGGAPLAVAAALGASVHTAVTVPISVRVPKFLPSVNGLHFINAWPHEAEMKVDLPGVGSLAIGDASNGLCGGMAYTVRDVFETAGMAPLATTDNPAEGSPLYRYVVDRLIASFDIPNLGFLRYYDWMMTPDGDAGWPPLIMRRGVAWKTIMEEWAGRIRPDLDAGRTVCLGLVTVAGSNPSDLGKNHQVLAYGYDLDGAGNLKVLVYDPNTPVAQADEVGISLNLSAPTQATPITHNIAMDHPIRGFFRTDYSYRNPTGLLG